VTVFCFVFHQTKVALETIKMKCVEVVKGRLEVHVDGRGSNSGLLITISSGYGVVGS
jgi:hypothetical protein